MTDPARYQNFGAEYRSFRHHPEGVILSRGRGAGARCVPAARC